MVEIIKVLEAWWAYRICQIAFNNCIKSCSSTFASSHSLSFNTYTHTRREVNKFKLTLEILTMLEQVFQALMYTQAKYFGRLMVRKRPNTALCVKC